MCSILKVVADFLFSSNSEKVQQNAACTMPSYQGPWEPVWRCHAERCNVRCTWTEMGPDFTALTAPVAGREPYPLERKEEKGIHSACQGSQIYSADQDQAATALLAWHLSCVFLL